MWRVKIYINERYVKQMIKVYRVTIYNIVKMPYSVCQTGDQQKVAVNFPFYRIKHSAIFNDNMNSNHLCV